MKTLLKLVGGVVLLVVVLGLGAFMWASSKASSMLAATFESHRLEVAQPYPLSAGELAAAPKDADISALTLGRALERGKHLVEARYGCTGCHGDNFGGGEMINDGAVGTILGPNITAGKGGRTANYTMADWDRIVRHGIKPDGHPAFMPSEDFLLMSDQELSDVVTYIRSRPTVDATVAAPTFGPIGKVLAAVGKFPLSAQNIANHNAAHEALPPPAEETVAFGRHLAGICTGCHRPDLSGGPISFGPPSWPVAPNLTPHETGLKSWTFEDFDKTLMTGMRKSGAVVRDPMVLIIPFTSKTTVTERKALWKYLQSTTPQPIGK